MFRSTAQLAKARDGKSRAQSIDWVIKVLSPSTAGHDQIRKRELYERHGMREYWLIHPVYRVLTIYSLIDGECGKPELFELCGETVISVLPDIVIPCNN